MTDDKPDIPPALTDREWSRSGFVSDRLKLGIIALRDHDPAGLVVSVDNGAIVADTVLLDVGQLAALIALANATMNDEDPRKFAREHVAALRAVAEVAGNELPHHLTTRAQVDLVYDLADVIESYLPPDPSIDRAPFKNADNFLGFPPVPPPVELEAKVTPPSNFPLRAWGRRPDGTFGTIDPGDVDKR